SIFAIDGMMTILIWLIILGAVFFQLLNTMHTQTTQLEELKLEEQDILIVDRLIKDRNIQSPIEGSAEYHPTVKRIESNVIDLELLKSITRQRIEGIE